MVMSFSSEEDREVNPSYGDRETTTCLEAPTTLKKIEELSFVFLKVGNNAPLPSAREEIWVTVNRKEAKNFQKKAKSRPAVLKS